VRPERNEFARQDESHPVHGGRIPIEIVRGQVQTKWSTPLQVRESGLDGMSYTRGRGRNRKGGQRPDRATRPVNERKRQVKVGRGYVSDCGSRGLWFETRRCWEKTLSKKPRCNTQLIYRLLMYLDVALDCLPVGKYAHQPTHRLFPRRKSDSQSLKTVPTSARV
jgi:hypothetical protein